VRPSPVTVGHSLPPGKPSPGGDLRHSAIDASRGARYSHSISRPRPGIAVGVSDEFPALEAALAVSLVVLAWRLGLLVGALKRARREYPDPTAAAHPRFRSRAGADLAIAAVLAGALIYAGAGGLEVGGTFLALGIVALSLLLGSAVIEVLVERALKAKHRRGRQSRPHLERAASGARPRLCTSCGSSDGRKVEGELGPKLAELGVESLWLCCECGHLEGRARAGTW
jgi:hypothetical protein